MGWFTEILNQLLIDLRYIRIVEIYKSLISIPESLIFEKIIIMKAK